MPVNNGDILVIPAPTEANKEGHRVTVKWQQTLSNKSADYYVLVALNKTQGEAIRRILGGSWRLTLRFAYR